MTPQIFPFRMQSARMQRGLMLFFGLVMAVIPIWAFTTGQNTSKAGLALLTCVIGLLGLALYYHIFLRRCFRSPAALEIHPEHIVVAMFHGPMVIPRAAVLAVKGPSEAYDTTGDLRCTPVQSVPETIELDVTAEYKVRTSFGRLVNPGISPWYGEAKNGYEMLVALKNWHNSTR